MYIELISKFIQDVLANDGAQFQENVIGVIRESTTSPEEIESWMESLPSIATLLCTLDENIKDNAQIVLEGKFGTDERMDVVLVGMFNESPVVIIIENKRWSNMERYEPVSDIALTDPYHKQGFIDHPSHQVEHYKALLKGTNQYIQDNRIEIYTAVYLQNATEDEYRGQIGPFDARYGVLVRENPIFITIEGSGCALGMNLTEYISGKINGGTENLAERIFNSQIQYSAEYRSLMANIFGNREHLLSLLDERQISIFEEIKCDITNRDAGDITYIVEGNPGTGKTLVALTLLAFLYQDNRNYLVKYVLKNKDARRAITRMNVPDGAVTYGMRGCRTISTA